MFGYFNRIRWITHIWVLVKNKHSQKSFLPVRMFIYRPINARARPVRCNAATLSDMPLRMPLFVACTPRMAYASLCSLYPQNGICGGTTPKNFLLASLAVIFVPPMFKLWRRPWQWPVRFLPGRRSLRSTGTIAIVFWCHLSSDQPSVLGSRAFSVAGAKTWTKHPAKRCNVFPIWTLTSRTSLSVIMVSRLTCTLMTLSCTFTVRQVSVRQRLVDWRPALKNSVHWIRIKPNLSGQVHVSKWLMSLWQRFCSMATALQHPITSRVLEWQSTLSWRLRRMWSGLHLGGFTSFAVSRKEVPFGGLDDEFSHLPPFLPKNVKICITAYCNFERQ